MSDSEEEAPPAAAAAAAAAAEEEDSEEDDLFADDAGGGASKASGGGGGGGGDDDDDDDLFNDEDDDEPVKPRASAAGGADDDDDDDDDDLFADSDDEAPSSGARHGRLAKGKAKGKKRGRPTERFDQKLASKKRLRKEAAGKRGAAASQEESFKEDKDAYAEEEDDEENAEDRNFIDEDDDNAGLLGEYARDNDRWDDDAPGAGDDGFSGRVKKRRGGDGGSRSSGPRQADYDKLEDGAVKEVFMKKKKRMVVEMTNEEKEEFVQDFLRRMSEAHDNDSKILSDPSSKEPAIHKLQMLPDVIATLQRRNLHNLLLDYDLLREMSKWIQPLEDKRHTLPNDTMRAEFIQRLHEMPIELDHLKRSGIGKAVMKLYKHPLESNANKRSLKELIERWARPIYNKTSTIRAERADVEAVPRRMSARDADGDGRMNINKTLHKRGAPRGEGAKRPSLEFHLGFDYQRMPAPRLGGSSMQSMNMQQGRFSTLQRAMAAKGRRKKR